MAGILDFCQMTLQLTEFVHEGQAASISKPVANSFHGKMLRIWFNLFFILKMLYISLIQD